MEDIAITIMQERIEAGVKMVKELAQRENLQMSEAIFVKGCECGVSMFIQKESARRIIKR